MLSILSLAIAFLIGSIPFGYLLAKARGIDIRQHGSGNIGATNVNRVLGKSAGRVTLVCDLLKGAIAAFFPIFLFPESPALSSLSALAAVCGHCFSPFLKFRGGKGVATGLGAFLVIAPLEAFVAIAVFVLVVKTSGFVSLGSVSAAATLPITLAFRGADALTIGYLSVTCAVIVMKHTSNIKRFLRGEELSYRGKSAKASESSHAEACE